MRRRVFFVIVFLTMSTEAFPQINKGQWLAGGNAEVAYSYNDAVLQGFSKSYDLSIQFSPRIGYFLVDQFAVGFRLPISHRVLEYSSSRFEYNSMSAAAFLRYYFLPLSAQRRWSVMADGGYALGRYSQVTSSSAFISKTTEMMFEMFLSGGPVFFINKNVGLECTISYSNRGVIDYPVSTTQLLFGVGLQVHLGSAHGARDNRPRGD